MVNAKDIKIDLDFGKDSTLLYQFIRGSHSHGIATETSDIDTMSVYLAPIELLLGFNKQEDFYAHDEKNDKTYILKKDGSLGEFMGRGVA